MIKKAIGFLFVEGVKLPLLSVSVTLDDPEWPSDYSVFTVAQKIVDENSASVTREAFVYSPRQLVAVMFVPGGFPVIIDPIPEEVEESN